MYAYKIERNVPVPKKVGRKRKYPFDIMKVGDSFAAPVKVAASMKACAMQFAKLHNRKFTMRIADGSIRCWRIK